jgi:hypothetical protein
MKLILTNEYHIVWKSVLYSLYKEDAKLSDLEDDLLEPFGEIEDELLGDFFTGLVISARPTLIPFDQSVIR